MTVAPLTALLVLAAPLTAVGTDVEARRGGEDGDGDGERDGRAFAAASTLSLMLV